MDGIFVLDIRFPLDYPVNPPRITFKTQIYHPNIDSDGRISLDILGSKWNPVLNIEKGKTDNSILPVRLH